MELDKKQFTVKEFIMLTGICQAKAYQIANSRYGGFRKEGRRFYITEDDLYKKYGIRAKGNVKTEVSQAYEDTLDHEFKSRVHACIYEFFKDVIKSEEQMKLSDRASNAG